MRKCIYVLSIFFGLFNSLTVYGKETTIVATTPEKSSIQKPKEENPTHKVLNDTWVPISTIITLLSVTIGIFISVRQYRLKVKEEIRLSRTAQSENDIKLLTLFSETIEIANGRKGHVISENILDKLFTNKIITSKDFKNLAKLGNVDAKLDIATRVIPVGSASQKAAIAAIGVLGKKYEILLEPASKGLNSLIAQGITDPTQAVLNAMNVPEKKLGFWKRIKLWW